MPTLILCRYLQLAVLTAQLFHTSLTLSYFTFLFTGCTNTDFWVLQNFVSTQILAATFGQIQDRHMTDNFVHAYIPN